MEPITLAAVTTAVVTLALDVAKETATEAAKDTWKQVKKWMGWEKKEPAVEDLPTATATTLQQKPELAEQIVAELNKNDTGAASRLISKVKITITNKSGDMSAGRDNFNFQGAEIKTGAHTKFGGG